MSDKTRRRSPGQGGQAPGRIQGAVPKPGAEHAPPGDRAAMAKALSLEGISVPVKSAIGRICLLARTTTAVAGPPSLSPGPSSARRCSREEVVTALERQLRAMRASRCDAGILAAGALNAQKVVAVAALHLATISSDAWDPIDELWTEEESRILHARIEIDGNVLREQGH